MQQYETNTPFLPVLRVAFACVVAIVLQRNKRKTEVRVYLVAVLLTMALFGAVGLTIVGVLAHAPVLTATAVTAVIVTVSAVIPVFFIS